MVEIDEVILFTKISIWYECRWLLTILVLYFELYLTGDLMPWDISLSIRYFRC
jgi:hypothetical protein